MCGAPSSLRRAKAPPAASSDPGARLFASCFAGAIGRRGSLSGPRGRRGGCGAGSRRALPPPAWCFTVSEPAPLRGRFRALREGDGTGRSRLQQEGRVRGARRVRRGGSPLSQASGGCCAAETRPRAVEMSRCARGEAPRKRISPLATFFASWRRALRGVRAPMMPKGLSVAIAVRWFHFYPPLSWCLGLSSLLDPF